ncbi:hypothetical protein [Bradyrhizobium jicamae]|nr:hypothetical protein [Bradyrhizobium jicamae]
MKQLEEKQNSGEETNETKLSRAAEARLVIEEYANDLREFIKRLRRRLN